MFCENCGAELQELNQSFCPNCGNPLRKKTQLDSNERTYSDAFMKDIKEYTKKRKKK